MELTAGAVAKGGVVVVGSGVGGYGIYSAVPGKDSDEAQFEGSVISEPKFLFQIKDFGKQTNEYTENNETFGYAFGRFLLNPDVNSDLWESKDEKLNMYKGTVTGIFESLKTKSNKDEMKRICKESYKKSKTSFSENDISYLWIFCSVSDNRPFVISKGNQGGDYEGKWASEKENKDALFDISNLGEDDNDGATWKHIYENFLKLDKTDNSKNIDQRFKNINSGSTLGEECERAYKSDATDTRSDYGDNVRKYCVIDASVILSRYPTKPVE